MTTSTPKGAPEGTGAHPAYAPAGILRRLRRAAGPAPVRQAALATAFLAATALAVLPASAAQAHDHPVAVSPEAGSTVAEAPGEVSVRFDDTVLDTAGNSRTTLLEVTGPASEGVSATRYYATGCATTDGRTISAPVALGPAGDYTIRFQIVSADGHPTSGEETFTYRPASTPDASAAGRTTPACAGDAAAAPAAPDSREGPSGAAEDAQAGPVVTGIVGAVAALAALAVIVVLLGARQRRAEVAGAAAGRPPVGGPAEGGSAQGGPAQSGHAGGEAPGERGTSPRRWRPDDDE